MKTRRILLGCCLVFLLVTTRFLSLDAHWSSDETRWLRRSAAFMSALKRGEFSETLIAHHPGVTTMWIAGVRTFFLEPRINTENLALARFFIGVVLLAGHGLAYLLLTKLFGRWSAGVCSLFLAFSPLLLAQTRRVHTDALAATFILLTVLLFLFYCQHRQSHRYLIFSGVTFGLAVLSKSYALILLPWFPVCLWLFRRKSPSNDWRTYFSAALVFLNSTALTLFAVWPVFWNPVFILMALCLFGLTCLLRNALREERSSLGLLILSAVGSVFLCVSAVQTIWRVFEGVNWAVTTPHEVEHFFLGRVVYDPGWFFYPLVITLKSTPLMLPLAFVGCFLLWKQRKQTAETGQSFRGALSLVVVIVLFTICLTLTSKKFARYLLPVFPMFDILAAIGCIFAARSGYTALRSRFGALETAKYRGTLVALVAVILFSIQAVPVLACHPY